MLFVCTGNLCRSPFAEIIARHLLVRRLGGQAAEAFEMASAGVHAVVGEQMHPDTRHQLARWELEGEPAAQFRARQLQVAMIENSDLVLGMTPGHRSAVVERCPAALQRSFGLREFARLAKSVLPADLPAPPAERARALVGLARRRRGMAPPSGPLAEQIPDPIGCSLRVHHEAAMLIEAAVDTIIDVIVPPGRR